MTNSQTTPEDPDRAEGLYAKYRVERRDGSSAPGGKHEHDQYFVLDLTTDIHARPAVAAYADSCKAAYPGLAADLNSWLDEVDPNGSTYDDRSTRATLVAHEIRKAHAGCSCTTGTCTVGSCGLWLLTTEDVLLIVDKFGADL